MNTEFVNYVNVAQMTQTVSFVSVWVYMVLMLMSVAILATFRRK